MFFSVLCRCIFYPFPLSEGGGLAVLGSAVVGLGCRVLPWSVVVLLCQWWGNSPLCWLCRVLLVWVGIFNN